MLIYLLGFCAVVFLLIVVFRLLFVGSREQVFLPNEASFVDPNLSNARLPFASIESPGSVTLSVVIPAYNEEQRLPVMLDEALSYLVKRSTDDRSFTFEVIIVDDGSRDATTRVALGYAKRHTVERVRVLTLQKNRGKGGAVKRGMLCARGHYVLMADADGATKFSDVSRLLERMRQIESAGFGFVLGSRAHLQDEAVAKRSAFRNLLMYGFHVAVTIAGVRGIRDTQCGFKLFSRRAAERLFVNLHVERWAFDVELVFLAGKLGITMAEVAVNWTEIDGSKLTPFAASVQMAKDLARIRLCYLLGLWRVDS